MKKVQPIDIDSQAPPPKEVYPPRADSAKPVFSRLRKLFDRQFPSVSRNTPSSAEKLLGSEPHYGKDGGATIANDQLEPSSVCLAKMVQNFIEEGNEKPAKYGRHGCNCFNGNGNDSSDDEFDDFGVFGESLSGGGSFSDPADALKNLIPCATVAERNILADTAAIVEKNKNLKGKVDLIKIVTENLSSMGYNASICKSKWEQSSSYPGGEYEYIDVIIEGERLLIDIDFRSQFIIARPTSTYKAILQSLPSIFVGKSDRLAQIISIAAEAAKQSLKKKAMYMAPWRKVEYMRAKWLSPTFLRARNDTLSAVAKDDPEAEKEDAAAGQSDSGEKATTSAQNSGETASTSAEKSGETASTSAENSGETASTSAENSGETANERQAEDTEATAGQPPAGRPRGGLASLLTEKP